MGLLLAVGAGIALAKGIGRSTNEMAMTTTPKERSGPERVSRCKEWAPRACEALIGCVPGFRTVGLPAHLESASLRFAQLKKQATELCEAEWKNKCSEYDNTWDGWDWQLDRCFDSVSYHCECNETNPAYCYPKSLIPDGLTAERRCPTYVPPTASTYMDPIRSIDEALAFASQYRVGGQGTASQLLAAWAVKRATWTDFATGSNDELGTSIGEVKKDPTGEYGRRMCSRGSTIQISKQYENLWEALIMVGRDVIHLTAIGSSETVVETTPATFCGIAFGLYTYETVAGNTNTAIEVVGMFDLPENHTHIGATAEPGHSDQ